MFSLEISDVNISHWTYRTGQGLSSNSANHTVRTDRFKSAQMTFLLFWGLDLKNLERSKFWFRYFGHQLGKMFKRYQVRDRSEWITKTEKALWPICKVTPFWELCFLILACVSLKMDFRTPCLDLVLIPNGYLALTFDEAKIYVKITVQILPDMPAIACHTDSKSSAAWSPAAGAIITITATKVNWPILYLH